MQDLNRDNATHLLLCTHAIGKNARYYGMPCHILKTMPDGRLKLQVYGERHWIDDRKDKKAIRYVTADRVRKLAQAG